MMDSSHVYGDEPAPDVRLNPVDVDEPVEDTDEDQEVERGSVSPESWVADPNDTYGMGC